MQILQSLAKSKVADPSCFKVISLFSEMANKLKKVYELEGLVCDLHAHFTAESGSTMAISKSKATDLISSTIFDYEPNTR